MRYFLTSDCSCPEPTEHEVSQADYAQALVRAGLRKSWDTSVPTDSFDNGTTWGRVEPDIDWDAVEALADEAMKADHTVISGFDYGRGFKAGFLAARREHRVLRHVKRC